MELGQAGKLKFKIKEENQAISGSIRQVYQSRDWKTAPSNIQSRKSQEATSLKKSIEE